MVEAHKVRAHSRVGPSAMKRIVACPGSVRASAAEPKGASSFFALEGTAAHELCEFVMTTGADPQDYLGGLVDLGPEEAEKKEPEAGNPVPPFLAVRKKHVNNEQPDDVRYWRIDEEMVEGAELYRDTVNSYVEDGDIVEFETRLDISHLHRDCFGTSDSSIFKINARHLVVVDYKYGSGIVVDVEDNEQVLCYASGVARRYHNYGIDKVTIVVVQPRGFHREGTVRKQTMDVIDLWLFEEFIAGVLASTDSGNSTFKAGSHCRFCPIAHKCNVLRKHCLTVIGARFGMKEIVDGDMPVIERMDKETMGRVYREVQIVEAWIRRYLEYAHKAALNGDMPEGCKLVAKRQYRRWREPDEVMAVLDLEGFDEEEFMTSPELRTPAQVEKMMGKKAFEKALGRQVTKTAPGFVLALTEDHRDAVKIDNSDAFGAAEDDDD